MINSFRTFYHVWMTYRLGIFNFTSIRNVLSENLDKLPFVFVSQSKILA